MAAPVARPTIPTLNGVLQFTVNTCGGNLTSSCADRHAASWTSGNALRGVADPGGAEVGGNAGAHLRRRLQAVAQGDPLSVNEAGGPASPVWVAWKPTLTEAFGAMVAL